MTVDPSPGPLAGATAALLRWLSRAGVPARVGLPTEHTGTPAQACVWPLAVLPEQGLRPAMGREPLRLRVRHLLVADGAPGPATDHALDRVLDAAARDGDFPLVVEPIEAELWAALGITPRPALQADMRAHIVRISEPAPRVRSPLRIEGAPMRTLHGKLVGPEGVPLVGIQVRAAGNSATTYTDGAGRFELTGLLPGDSARLLLSGRGLHLQAEVATATAEPVVIHCDIQEV